MWGSSSSGMWRNVKRLIFSDVSSTLNSKAHCPFEKSGKHWPRDTCQKTRSLKTRLWKPQISERRSCLLWSKNWSIKWYLMRLLLCKFKQNCWWKVCHLSCVVTNSEKQFYVCWRASLSKRICSCVSVLCGLNLKTTLGNQMPETLLPGWGKEQGSRWTKCRYVLMYRGW
jgi:hypothetical protein